MRKATVNRLAAAGWALAGGIIGAGIRAAESAFVCLAIPAQRGTYRLRFGVRVAALERREHGTPTRRASTGHWVRIAAWPFLGTAADAAAIARVALECASGAGAGMGSFDPASRGRDPNRCATRVDSNAPEPRVGAGAGRGRAVRGMPGSLGVFGFSPACGGNVGTHDPGRIKARARRTRAARAGRDYRNSRRGKLEAAAFEREVS